MQLLTVLTATEFLVVLSVIVPSQEGLTSRQILRGSFLNHGAYAPRNPLEALSTDRHELSLTPNCKPAMGPGLDIIMPRSQDADALFSCAGNPLTSGGLHDCTAKVAGGVLRAGPVQGLSWAKITAGL